MADLYNQSLNGPYRTKTHHSVGDVKQAELWLKYLSFFFFFSVSAAHSAQTLNPAWKLYRFFFLMVLTFSFYSSRGSSQLTCSKETHQTLQTSIFLKTGHLLALLLCVWWMPKKKLAFLKKECLFSAYGGFIKKISSISYKNTCIEEKKMLWLWQFCRRQKSLLEISE